jgi:CheY-like chemotaxis protein
MAYQILLVEDNPYDALSVLKALGDNSLYDLTAIEDGVQAMAYLRRQEPYTYVPRPDLILLDLKLPKKDGFAVLAEIRADEHLKHIPVAVVTAYDLDSQQSAILNVDGVVKKEMDRQAFSSSVQRLVDRRRGNEGIQSRSA